MTGDFDYRLDFPKQASRLWTVAEMRRSVALTESDGTLRSDLVDLCGRGAPLLRALLLQGMLGGRGRYFGVDRDPADEIVAHNRAMYSGEARAEFYRLSLSSFLCHPEFPSRCAMTAYDPCGEGDGYDWRNDLRMVRSVAQSACQRLGGFLVAANGGIRRKVSLDDFLGRAADLGGRSPGSIFCFQYRGLNFTDDGRTFPRTWRAVVVLHFRPPRVGPGPRELLLDAVRAAVAEARPQAVTRGKASVVGRWPSVDGAAFDELLRCGHVLYAQGDTTSQRICPLCHEHAASEVVDPRSLVHS